LGEIWGGTTIVDISQKKSVFDFVVDFNNAQTYDPNASIIVFLVWHHQMGWAIQYIQSYTEPVENPPVFKKLSALPSMKKTNRMRTVKDLADEIGAVLPSGQRTVTASFTFKNNTEFMEVLAEITNKTVSSVSGTVEGLLFAVVYQPQPQTILLKSTANGNTGNSLGLGDSEDDLMNALAMALWQNEKDDQLVESAVRELVEQGVAEAKKMGVWHRYVYMNYAAEWQDVMGGYGEENVRAMIEVSKKYDRDQVFQVAVPGGFKLAGLPSSRPVHDEL
jgi:hypothetical protein